MTDSAILNFPPRTAKPSLDRADALPEIKGVPAWASAIPKESGPLRDILVDLVESISDGFALYDSQDRMVLWNEKYAAIVSYARDLMTPGVPFETLLRKCAEQHFLGTAASEDEKDAWIQEAFHFQRTQSTYERPSSDGRSYLVSRRRSRNNHTAVVWTDVTAQKQANVALQQSEKLYRALFESSHQGIAVEDEKRLIQANGAFYSIFGLTLPDRGVTIKELEALIVAGDRARVRRIKKDLLSRNLNSADLEIQAVRKIDGRQIWVRATAVCIEWDGNPTLQVAYTDVTEQREFNEQLLAKKLEALGAMAHGIAIEFNKVHSSIMGAVRMAQMESYALGQSTLSEMLAHAEQFGNRASELTQELLLLHTRGVPVKQRTTVEELLNTALLAARQDGQVVPLRKPNVRIKLDVGGRLWPLDVDKGQMTRVLGTLIGSGIQAMPLGGTLSVHAENFKILRKLKGVPLPAGDYVKVSIADQGSGLAEDRLDKVFDPYSNSLPRTNGLSLTSAYSVVKMHGGTIVVSSRPGKGTRMTVYLPGVAEGARRKAAR
jgi:PAS domain S-box-containing protein